MEKYMGNKSKIVDRIYESTMNFIDDEVTSIFDVFAGTTNVGRKFKENGFEVFSNDINDLSYVLGKCYLESKRVPTFNKLFKSDLFSLKFISLKKTEVFRHARKVFIKENRNTTSEEFLENNKSSNYINALVYLSFFATENDYLSLNYNPYNLIQKNYCEFGENSSYVNLVRQKSLLNLKNQMDDVKAKKYIDNFLKPPFSILYLEKLEKYLRETPYHEKISKILKENNITGNRMFFSTEHGRRIDIILNLINYWYSEEVISDTEFYTLLTSLIESVAIFSNTSATYQAFYKTYRANTKQVFRLLIPEIKRNNIKSKIYQEDAFEIVKKVRSDVLYLDPPYNWRQYDSNYHLLNTIARFHNIENIEEFESGIVGASGENRIQKATYTSYHNGKFKDHILETISKSKCRYIILSYSDSESNHKGLIIADTLREFDEFFSNKKIFERYEKVLIESTNFESRKGNKKIQVNELLYIAKKRGI